MPKASPKSNSQKPASPKKNSPAPSSKKPLKSESDSSPNASTSETPSKSSPKKPSKGKPAREKIEREVIYPEPTVKLCMGAKAITEDLAKQVLGWREAPEGVTEGVYVIGDQRVFLVHNATNRPLDLAKVATLQQEILRGNWELNGETIIIGKTGQILNGQHSLIALILACKEYQEAKYKWQDVWKHPPTLDKLVVFGISESDKVINTLDTAKPRTLWEVIYRSEYFADLKTKERKTCAKMAEAAVKMLWDRTGAKEDAYAPIRTHRESLGFIERHERLLKAVRHIHDEDGAEKRISIYLSRGYASALLYMMAVSKTDRDEENGYSKVQNPCEDQLDFSQWDLAQNFFVELAAGDKGMEVLKEAFQKLFNTRGSPSVSERVALLVKAWNVYADGDAMEEGDLELEYVTNEFGVATLSECPSVGGIDLGRLNAS